MAGIDKTYVNYDQYLQAFEFHKNTLDKQIKETGRAISLYYDKEEAKYLGDNFCLWNTSSIHDAWLYKNCKLDFVQERILQQYREIPKLWELIDFNFPNTIITEITDHKNIAIYFYKEEDDEHITVYDNEDNFVVYGSTDFFEIINNIKNFMEYGIDTHNTINFDISIIHFGINMTYYTKEKKWVIDNDNSIKDILPLPNSKLLLPNFKYSFNGSDIYNFDTDKSIFSNYNKDIVMLDAYEDYEKLIKTKPFPFNKILPDYLTNLIYNDKN